MVSSPSECKANEETAVSWNTGAHLNHLLARIAALKAGLAHFSLSGNDIHINGANLHIQGDFGATCAAPPNGLGNLTGRARS